MVMIWNQLARGNHDYCAILVVVNSILQIVLYSPLALLFVNVISNEPSVRAPYGNVAISVLIVSVLHHDGILHLIQRKYLGIPLIAGVITRYTMMLLFGRFWFERRFLPIFSPLALIGLLYTIIVMFAFQGHHILHNLGPVFRVFVPMILYFLIMWCSTFALCYHLTRKGSSPLQFGYELAVVQSFTAGSNNFVSYYLIHVLQIFIYRPPADALRTLGISYRSVYICVGCRFRPSVSSNNWPSCRSSCSAFPYLGSALSSSSSEMVTCFQ